MRIAYLSTFYPFRGGIAQFNASLYRAFESQHQVAAVTFKRQYPNFLFPGQTQYVTENDKADIINSVQILDTINPISYIKTAKVINQFTPHMLIMKYWMSFFGPSLGTVAKRMAPSTKVISILDNVIPHEKRILDKTLTDYFLKYNDGFIVMSDAVKDDLLSLTKGKAKYLKIDHPLYNHFGDKINASQARISLNLHREKKTILFFGFIRDYKGLDLLIDAFSRLDDTYQLVIAGECYGSFEKYIKQIESLPNKHNIHSFNTYISDDKVPVFFSAADVCVLPYKSATQSGITAIAYHFDLPLIATDVGGLKENIFDGKTGLIAQKADSASIEKEIKNYFQNNLKGNFEKNIQVIKKEKSWLNFSNQIVQFSHSLK